MGRIKNLLIKRTGKQLFNLYGDKFTKDFYENKKIISKYASISSKKLRNTVTGYLTKLVKQNKIKEEKET